MLENSIFDDTEFLEGEILEQVVDLNKKEQEKVVEAQKEDVVVEPDSDMQVLSKVTVKGVTADIDESIKPENIKLGVNILGIEGNVAPDKPDQEKTIYPSEEEQIVVADNGYELAKVIAKPVETESFEIIPNTSEQVVKASDGKFIKEVVVEAIEDIEPEVAAQEEKLQVLEGKVDDLPIYEPIGDDLVEQADVMADIKSQVDSLKDISNETLDITENGEYDVLDYGKVVVDAKEDLEDEFGVQDEELAGLEADVEALEDKPQSDIQYMIDESNSCKYMFYYYGGTSLPFVKNLNTSNVTDMSYMFGSCTKLENIDLSNFNTENVTTFVRMFDSCFNLKDLDLSSFNTTKVTNMTYMFYCCFNYLTSPIDLDLSNFETPNLTQTENMFDNCRKIKSLNVSNFNVGKISSMRNMFRSCVALTSLDISNWDTVNVTSMNALFSSCSELVNIIGVLDMFSVTDNYYMVGECKKLETITLKNIKKSLQLGSGTSYGTLLTNETLINTIQQLWDFTGSTSQTLTLSTTSKTNIANIYVKLITPTQEQIDADPYINNKKPCVVCESTDEGAMTLTEYATSKNWAIA